MKRIYKWLLSYLSSEASDLGQPLTSQNSSDSSTKKSTAAPSTTPKAAESKPSWSPDARSAKNIATLEPQTARLATEHLRRLHLAGLNFKVTSARRTFAEQAALFAKGRTAKGPKVTNARPGSSWHNYGVAYDLTLFDSAGKKPIWDGPQYDVAGAMGRELGLKWGGDFKSFKDRPHFERPLGMTTAQAKRKWPDGMVA